LFKFSLYLYLIVAQQNNRFLVVYNIYKWGRMGKTDTKVR
jgi:hypothetical protein